MKRPSRKTSAEYNQGWREGYTAHREDNMPFFMALSNRHLFPSLTDYQGGFLIGFRMKDDPNGDTRFAIMSERMEAGE